MTTLIYLLSCVIFFIVGLGLGIIVERHHHESVVGTCWKHDPYMRHELHWTCENWKPDRSV